MQPRALPQFLGQRGLARPFWIKKKELCNFTATWCACPIFFANAASNAAISKKKKGTVRCQCHLVHLDNFGRLLCNFTGGTCSCAISAPPCAIQRFHCEMPDMAVCQLCNFVAASCAGGDCAISLPPCATGDYIAKAGSLQIRRRLEQLCNFNAKRGICAISLPPCAAGIVNCAISLPPWATAAAVQFRCRPALSAIFCQRVQSANTPPPCAVVQFQCQTWQLCNFTAALCR